MIYRASIHLAPFGMTLAYTRRQIVFTIGWEFELVQIPQIWTGVLLDDC